MTNTALLVGVNSGSAAGSWNTCSALPALNQWSHLAICRSGTDLRCFLNGTSILNVTNNADVDNSDTLRIGYWRLNAVFEGYMDDIRFSGVARYTSNFTAPTAAFLDTGPTLDLSSGNTFVHAPSANVAYAFSNPPASGTAIDFTLKVTGAGAYDIANASYDSVSFSVASQDGAPQDLTFKSDGTKMYISGNTNNSVFQYSLSTAWDISTASYESKSFSVASQEGSISDTFFKPDGSKFYICGFSTDTVYQYSMSTYWDVSTASYDSVSFSVASQEANPRGLVFKSDGSKMFIIGNGSDAISEYALSTSWDVSTSSYTTNFSVSSQEASPQGLFFAPDGYKVWIIGGGNTVYQYSLTTAWDISTTSYDNVSFSASSQSSTSIGVEFKSNGSKMYILDNAGNNVYQYSTVAATPSTITWPSSVKWAGGTAPSAPASGETDAFTFYSTDGGTSYYGFHAGDAYS
jgi:hypothetical protein